MASQHPYISETSAQEQLHSSQRWDRSKLKRVYSLATSKGLVFLAGSFADWLIGSAVYCVTTKTHTTARRSLLLPFTISSFLCVHSPGGKCSMPHPPPFPLIKQLWICKMTLGSVQYLWCPKPEIQSLCLIQFYIIRWTTHSFYTFMVTMDN